MLAVDAEAVTLAGAFILGATLGGFAAIRVMRAVLHTFDTNRRRRERDTGES